VYDLNPYLELQTYRAREQELERKLAMARALVAGRTPQAGLAERALVGAGNALIALGQRLKERSVDALDYAPACG
jgi:hypothetical protein